MPDRALAHMFGGLGDFIKTRRGLQQNTEDRDMRKKEFDSAQQLREVQRKSGELSNTRTQQEIDRAPTSNAQADLDFFIKNFGAESITEDHYKAYAGTDPVRLAQLPGIRAGVAAAAARKKIDDAARANQGKVQDLTIRSMERKEPGEIAAADRVANAWAWLSAPENRGKDWRTDRTAYEMNKAVGNDVSLTPHEEQQFRLKLAAANAPNYGAAEEARYNIQQRIRAESLPANVDAKVASIFDTLAAPLITNINNSMKAIEAFKRDYTPADKTGFGNMSTGNGPSAAAQANQAELIRVSDALYLEADSIIGQMRKAGVPANSPGEEWARGQLRQYLATVPKFWEGKIVGGARTGVAGPATTQTTGGQLRNQGR